MPQDIIWKAYEHQHSEKSTDWFWALGIVAVSSAIVALLFKNFLFALLILVGSCTMALLAKKPARELTFSLSKRGITIEDSLYPYQMLVAFWIHGRDTENPTLIIDARKFMTPHLIAELDPADTEKIHAYLSEYLPEEEIHEPFLQRLLEMFGF